MRTARESRPAMSRATADCAPRPADAPIQDRADFRQIRYGSCWEDADLLCEALGPRPGMRILSIAAAGDNALALLAEGAEVVAADLSAAQLACLELRCAAFRNLSHPEVLAFLGARPAADRGDTFRKLKEDLSPAARRFWSERLPLIEAGAIHAGKLERFFRAFRTRLLPLIHGRRVIEELLAEKDEGARRAFFDRKWNSLRWRLMFRLSFNRLALGRLGRDPEFFRYVEGSVAERLLQRAHHALTSLPTHSNPYLRLLLTGEYGLALPRYLRPEHYQAIRAGLDRLTLRHGSVEEAAANDGGGFDGFNLSDIFEYLDLSNCRRIYESLLEQANPGARLAYWNLLVPRSRPVELADRVRCLTDAARRLASRDAAFFYSNFVLEEVL